MDLCINKKGATLLRLFYEPEERLSSGIDITSFIRLFFITTKEA